MKWQTRHICTFVAATIPVEKAGDVNPLLEHAQKIGIDEADDDKQTATSGSATEPQVGSYERFMNSFGNPARWAGRG